MWPDCVFSRALLFCFLSAVPKKPGGQKVKFFHDQRQTISKENNDTHKIALIVSNTTLLCWF